MTQLVYGNRIKIFITSIVVLMVLDAMIKYYENVTPATTKFEKKKYIIHPSLEEIKEMVQSEFENRQHPENCDNTKKLVCFLKSHCGIGCEFHMLGECFGIAYDLKRVLVIADEKWKFYPGGWNRLFQPAFSSRCKITYESDITYWPNKEDSELLVNYWKPWTTPLHHQIKIPTKYSNLLDCLIKNKNRWWMAQIIGYLFRPSDLVMRYMKEKEKSITYIRPFVGFHIRRTDKIAEAEYQDVSRYVLEANKYFDGINYNKSINSYLYVATDEKKVLNELNANYKNYTILEYGKMYGDVNTKEIDKYYKANFDFWIDIQTLVESDYVVCTLSSNVCRLLYELRLFISTERSENLFSLDSKYYYHGQSMDLLTEQTCNLTEVDKNSSIHR